MQVKLIAKSLKKIESDIEIIVAHDKKSYKAQKDILSGMGFSGKDEEVAFLPESKKIYVGCESLDHDNIRIAIGEAIKKFNSTKLYSAKISIFGENREEVLNSLVEGTILAGYGFKKYKSKKDDSKEKILLISCEKEEEKTFSKIVEDAQVLSDAVNSVRDMVNTVPADFYPAIMASKALEIANDCKLECNIFDTNYLEETNMNAMLAVARASDKKPKLIHLTHSPENAKAKIVLVGKGLTYDSGGLSLKPGDFMVTMKSDKSGGCAVLGIMQAVAKLNLPIEVHGIVGAVENMIGGDAYKPDDVLKARNGVTIEVRNTDAEGRLVLADCLAYAQEEIEDIDYIFDYATLTGACVVGVGEYTTGIMGNNNELKKEAVEKALDSGELATALDFNRYLKKAIKSQIADISNLANTRYGGAITAGQFLDNFIEDKYKDKWLHFDIAGPAYVEKAWGYNPFGASGAGVRMTINFLKSLSK